MPLPPGPPAWNPISFLRDVFNPAGLMRENVLRYGDPHTMYLPRRGPVVFMSHPDAIKEIFTGSADDLHAGEANFVVEGLLGPNSLLLLDGSRHLRERRLLLPPFHGERMKAYGETMRRIADAAIDAFPLHRPFAIQEPMQDITLEVILETVFGLTEGPSLRKLHRALPQAIGTGSGPWMMLLAYLLPAKPLIRFLEMMPWVAFVRHVREVHELLYEEIRRRRAEDVSGREDVLSMLVAARHEDGTPMSDEELHDELMTLVVAGHETTATSLAWFFHHVLPRPDVMQRLLDELKDGPVPVDQLNRLTYLDAAINESMRLTPIVPVVARRLKRHMTIGGWDLPQGTYVLPAIYLAHLRKDTWGDPNQFRPERFIGKRIDPYRFFPFGGGVRRCLGAPFALYEMKIVITQLLTRLKLRLDATSHDPIVRRGVTLSPRSGVRIIVDERRPLSGSSGRSFVP